MDKEFNKPEIDIVKLEKDEIFTLINSGESTGDLSDDDNAERFH